MRGGFSAHFPGGKVDQAMGGLIDRQTRQAMLQDPRYQKYEKYGDQLQLEADIERDAMAMFKKKQQEKIEGLNGYFEFMRLDFPG